MAKIVKTDSAPSEAVHYTFAAGEFDLGGRKKFYETEDLALISEANTHPDLRVEVEAVEVFPTFHEQVAPEDDALSAENSAARRQQEEADETAPVSEEVELDEESTTDKE